MFEADVGPVVGVNESSASEKKVKSWVPLTLAVAAALCFYFSTKATQTHFDYTYRIAGALLKGHLGLQESISWLNELVPMEGKYYSVFPLGAVIAMVPVALLNKAGLVREFPGLGLAAVLAGACVYFFFQLSGIENISLGRRIILALFPIFGTWSWCNIGFAGAWQIALGFALLGETAALYFTLVRPRPLLAGIFFALAFGNRTELILTLPIFMYFWFFRDTAKAEPEVQETPALPPARDWKTLLQFLALPIALGLCTAAYNFARFHSIFDFGYARIPGVLQEPWYRAGLFSLTAIPWNAYKMLLEGMQSIPQFPYFRPYAFGCSIFISSPFLFLLFRQGGRYRKVCWIAIATLTLFLWCHGNPGGWQFSYRYGMVLLPWMFLLLVGNGPRKISVPEFTLFVVSIAVNAVAVHQFLWINEIKP